MEPIKKVVLASAVLLIVCRPAHSEGPPAVSEVEPPVPHVRITPEGLVQEALAKNPGIGSKKAAYEAARARVFGAYLPEDPMFGVDAEGQPGAFEVRNRMNDEYMAEQEIPFPVKLLFRGAMAAREADMAYQEYKEEEREVIWHVEQPYYDLFLAKKTVAALEATKGLIDQISRSAQARYESGQVGQQDLLKAQIERSRILVEIFEWKEKEHLAQAHFSHLLDRPLHTVYEIPEKSGRSLLLHSRSELEGLALSKRPELLALKAGIEKAKAGRALTQTEWLPDIKARYEKREFRDGRADEHDAFIGFSVPVWSLLKGAGGAWTGADLEVRSAEALYDDMKNEALLALHEAYSRFKSAENALLIYENSILPQSRQQAEVALTAYEAGKADLLELVEAGRDFKGAQIGYYKSAAEYEKAFSDLGLAVGDDLS